MKNPRVTPSTSANRQPTSFLPGGSPERPNIPHPPTRTILLAVSQHQEDFDFLRHTLEGTNWCLCPARSYREALAVLCRDRMPVVICRRYLPDGNWCDILSQTAELPEAPRLIVVCTEPLEQLSAEVLHVGGYDVLIPPLDAREVLWKVGCAWRDWESEYSRVRRHWKT